MAIDLLHELRALGVVLSTHADGRLAYDAPVGVIDDDLLARMRADRDVLLELLRSESTGPEYLAPMPGVICPWCRSGDHLLEHLEGLRCDQCGRDAFRFDGDVIVRCDWVDDALETILPVDDRPVKKRPSRIERNVRPQPGLVLES